MPRTFEIYHGSSLNRLETGKAGERAAAKLLWRWFRTVTSTSPPAKDGGIDLTCSGWLVERLEHKECEFWVQVKSGTSYYGGIPIEPTTFNYWLRFIERYPLILFHYPRPSNNVMLPESVLALYPWIVANLPDLRDRLQHKRHIRIPIKAFRRITHDQQVREILEDEEHRVSHKTRSIFGTRTDNYIGEYDYFLNFPGVARRWERSELGLTHHDSESLDEVFNVMDLHPIDRAPIERLEKAQVSLYSALQGNPESSEWRLALGFNAWTVAAARAMAAKYEGFWPKAMGILKTWRVRPVTDVLVALQMLGIAGIMDERVANQVPYLLKDITSELPSRLNSLAEYRLSHHALVAQSEIFGDHRAAKKAVALARCYPDFEIRHLRSYGWGFGPHILTYYDRAIHRNTVRSEKSKDYNRGMRDLMVHLVTTSTQIIVV